MPFSMRAHKSEHKRNVYIVLFVFLMVLFLGLWYSLHTRTQPEYLRDVVSKHFHEREQQIKEATEFLSIQPTTNLSVFTGNEKKWDKQGFAFFLYESDSLKAWSTQNIDPPKDNLASLKYERIIEVGDGYYTPCLVSKGDTIWLGLALIQHNYGIENEYLINSFHNSYGIDGNIPIAMNKTYYNVYDEHDRFIFGLDFSSYRPQLSTQNSALLFAVFIAWLMLLNTILQHVFRIIFRKMYLQHIGLMVFVVGFRILQIVFRIPGILYQTDFFQPFWYASSFWMPSLGDVCVCILLFMQLCFLVMKKNLPAARVKLHLRKTPLSAWIVPVLCFTAAYILLVLTANFYRSLVRDTLLDISLRGIFTQMPGSLFLHLTVCLLSFAWVIFAWYMVFLGKKWQKDIWILVLCQLPGIIIGVCLMQHEYATWLSMSVVGLAFCLLLYFSLFYFRLRNFLSGTFLLVVPLILTAIASCVILDTQARKKQANSELVLSQISSFQDPVAEFLFTKIEHDLMSDTHLKTLLMQDAGEDTLRKYVKDNFFQNYWDKYVIDVMTCCQEDNLLVSFEDSIQSCTRFFKRRIKHFGIPTSSPRLYLLNETLKQTNYIAEFSFDFDNHISYLYIEFSEKTLFDNMGYPDLLMDQFTKGKNKRLNEYSHALYENGVLMRQSGNYSYPRQMPKSFTSLYNKQALIEIDGYNHHIQSQPNGKTWVLSQPVHTWQERLSTSSYLFILHVFMMLCMVGLAEVETLSWIRGSFKNRIQYSIVLLVIITTAIFAFRSINYIQMVNQKKYEKLMIDKARSIALDLEPFIDQKDETLLEDAVMYDSYLFYTDINIFDTEGKLWVTSRPEIYNERLTSTLMHPHAFSKIKMRDLGVWVQQEFIGNQPYHAIYMPIHNKQRQMVAFLHLPTFSQQTQLEQEVVALLTSYVNVYVLLFILAIAITLLLSAWLTYPLQKLQRYMQKVQLGKENEKIAWNRRDEIGSLINEYNNMVDQLENHAYMLAKSEREAAWRNMAKQVAHEIKNPLTPMKLSIQLIQRIRKENPKEFARRYDEFSSSLVEQIDSITTIVSTLSDIARVHPPKTERIDLIACIKKVAYLYNDDMTHVFFENSPLSEAFILGDSTQMVQVINNLLKNASQSAKKTESIGIWISIIDKTTHYQITIADNGMGIHKEDISKVFLPNFTTKATGTGIGLALVKSIVESFNGTITCDSQEGEGTTFTITFPKA